MMTEGRNHKKEDGGNEYKVGKEEDELMKGDRGRKRRRSQERNKLT